MYVDMTYNRKRYFCKTVKITKGNSVFCLTVGKKERTVFKCFTQHDVLAGLAYFSNRITFILQFRFFKTKTFVSLPIVKSGLLSQLSYWNVFKCKSFKQYFL